MVALRSFLLNVNISDRYDYLSCVGCSCNDVFNIFLGTSVTTPKILRFQSILSPIIFLFLILGYNG